MTEYQNFVPEAKIHIDAVASLDQISGRFRSVKDGLPELVKNSKDHYARLGVTEKEKRQIVVLISRDKKKLGVLDFAGAALEDFEGWKTWSSSTSNRREMSGDIEAGHGNGGKSFMVRGCVTRSSMCGFRDEKANKRGFINDNPTLKYKEVVFKNSKGNMLQDLEGLKPEELLSEELKMFEVGLSNLPAASQNIFRERQCFTFVQLWDVADWVGETTKGRERSIARIPVDLAEHAQASLTIETCTLWIQEGVHLLSQEPIAVAKLEPLPGLESIPPIPIPSKLVDPDTEEEVALDNLQPPDVLVIESCKHNLRLSDKYKARNVIRVKNGRNIVANWSVPDLVPSAPSSFIYGTLVCSLLTDDLVGGSDRNLLADVALTRALKHWTAEHLAKVAKQIQKLQATRNTEEDRSAASDTINKLRDLMKQYLDIESVGGGEGDRGDNEPGRTREGFGERVDEILLEAGTERISIAQGSSVPIIVKCFQVDNGRKIPVKCNSLILYADSEDVVEYTALNVIKGIGVGVAPIYFQTSDGRVSSNIVDVEVFNITRLSIQPPDHILKQGERIKLSINQWDDKNIPIQNIIYEAQVDEQTGKIGRNGYFTAGGAAGISTVRIIWGEKEDHFSTCGVEIGEERIEKQGGKKSGSEIPYILLCGESAPEQLGFEELPQDQRTHSGGEEFPTIIDFDPIWENKVIWINQYSKESLRVRKGGPTGTYKTSCKTYREFLALKCFEILIRLRVKIEIGEDSKVYIEYIEKLANAEIETAGFLESAYDLVDNLINEDDEEDELL